MVKDATIPQNQAIMQQYNQNLNDLKRNFAIGGRKVDDENLD